MQTYTANQAKQELGRVIDAAQRAPVIISRHNRPAAVVMSIEEYDKIHAVNVVRFNEFCDKVGAQAKANGLTEEVLNQILAGE
jgi:antitoxin Phd